MGFFLNSLPLVLALLVMGCSFFIETEEDIASDTSESSESESSSVVWKLPEDYYVEAKMDLHAVYPQPNDDTHEEARYKWAHTGMTYEIPLGVQGGAWPFLYELIEGPTDASVGQIYGEDNYGNISWAVPDSASGTYSFEVLVTDQDNKEVTLEWDVEINDDMFVFIEDGYTGNQTGTIDEPLEDIADWYLEDREDDTYQGRIVVFREGEYELDGDDDYNNFLNLGAGTKSRSFIAYPDETAIVDCSLGKVITSSDDGAQDFYVAGVEWENARTDVDNSHFFWMTYYATRAVFWKNTFRNLESGEDGTDNNAAVFFSDYTVQKENILYKENLHEDFDNMDGNNGGYVDIYNANYVLVEGNVARDSSTAWGFWMKCTDSYITVRNNVAVDNVSGYQITMGVAHHVDDVPHDMEVCWNRLLVDESLSSNIFIFASTNNWAGEHYNDWIYRNTFVYGEAELKYVGAENYESEDNLIISSDLDTYYAPFDTTIGDNIGDLTFDSDDVTVSDIVDEEGFLTGDYHTDYYGLKGAEVDMTQAEESE